MGAGISPRILRKRLYYALKCQQRDLNRAGIPTLYKNLQLFPDMTGRNEDFAFNIQYRVLRASNGETCAMRYVTVINNGTETVYGKNWDAEQGIEAIKQHYLGGCNG